MITDFLFNLVFFLLPLDITKFISKSLLGLVFRVKRALRLVQLHLVEANVRLLAVVHVGEVHSVVGRLASVV